MFMTKKELARVAKNLHDELKGYNLDSLEGLKAKEGQPMADCVDNAHSGEEFVIVGQHPQAPGSWVISYHRRTGQNPIQVVVNPQKDYIRVTLTCETPLEGYEIFAEEPEFGKMMDKVMTPLDFKALFKELEKLSKLA